MEKRVLVTGGTGFIGSALCAELSRAGYEPIVLSRRAAGGGFAGVRLLHWDAHSAEGWCGELDGAFALINLAGENIGSGRWTARKKTAIRRSRLEAGQAVAAAFAAVKKRPRVLVQASAIGWYGDRGDEVLDEGSRPGSGYLSLIGREWEGSTEVVDALGVRRVVLRTGVVLGRGGVLSRAAIPFRLFAGGVPGSGRPWVSWIHIEDVVRAIRFLLEREDARGVYNLTAPGAVRSAEFYRAIGRALRRPVWAPVPGLLLKAVFGEMARELMLSRQRVLPKRLLEAGFEFKHERLEEAMGDIFGGW